MASADLKRTRALVARYLDPGARWSAADDRALRDLCRADEASAAEYDRQVTLYRELVGADPMLPSGHEQQRMMAAVLDAVPVMVTESAFAPEPTPSPLLRWLRPMMGVLAGACALLAVVVGMSDDSIGLRVPDEAIVNARLTCAEAFLAGGKRTDALAIYQALAKAASGKPDAKAVELAATRGILTCADAVAAAS